MYSQLNYLITQQRSSELRATAARTRAAAERESALRGSGRRHRTGQLTTLVKSLSAQLTPAVGRKARARLHFRNGHGVAALNLTNDDGNRGQAS